MYTDVEKPTGRANASDICITGYVSGWLPIDEEHIVLGSLLPETLIISRKYSHRKDKC